MIFFLYIFFFLVIFFKIMFIQQDNTLHLYKKKIYYKKPIKKIIRGNIYDKNDYLINFSRIIYKTTDKNKYIQSKRHYLFPSCLSVVGLADVNNKGLSGIELYYNDRLTIEYEKRFFSKICNSIGWVPKYECLKRNDIYLTLDAVFSEKVFFLLKNAVLEHGSQYGVCIIMDGKTGAIEVMTQFPQYEINTSKKEGIGDDFFLYPLGVTQSYEIGSIMKAFLMISAFEEKLLKATDLIDCYGVKVKKMQGIPLSTWKAHGTIPFKMVIKESNNFGVAKVGLLLGEKLYYYYHHLGFGESTEIDLSGENRGRLYTPKQWSKRSPISLSFGYEVSSSLLQLVSAWSVFTNDGQRVYPRLLKESNPKYYFDYIFSKNAIDESNNILLFDKNHYMIKKQKILFSDDILLYGKTGTANSLVNGAYEKNSTNNKYSFVGHFEKKDTKKIIGIFISGSSNGKSISSHITLPLFFNIVSLMDKM